MANFVLDDEPRFGIVHHRKLNDEAALTALLPVVERLPGFLHIAEGDLCWACLDGEYVLYFHHPDRLIDARNPASIAKARDKGTLWTLDRALDPRFDNLTFIVELKIGDGHRAGAIAAAVDLLESGRPGRYWIDTFSVRDTLLVKDCAPTAVTSLHTKFLSSALVLKTALAFPPVSLRRPRRLDSVDIFTLTYKTSTQRLLPWCSLTATAENLGADGKRLVCGGVATPAMLAQVHNTGARAAYIKFPWQEIPE